MTCRISHFQDGGSLNNYITLFLVEGIWKVYIFHHLFVCFQTSVYTLGEFHKNRNNSTVFEELTVSIVDLTVANISFLLRQNWLGPEPTSVIAVSNYWTISWLTKDSLVENIRQNWLGQEPTSVITVSNYWAISWLTRHSLVEKLRQNWLGQEPTSVI
jgi:hypothetical protein